MGGLVGRVVVFFVVLVGFFFNTLIYSDKPFVYYLFNLLLMCAISNKLPISTYTDIS